MRDPLRYIPCGDAALIIKTGDDICLETHVLVRKLVAGIQKASASGIIECIPSYNEIMVAYDPTCISHNALMDILHKAEDEMDHIELPAARRLFVPVVYGGSYGEDLAKVASHGGFSEEKVVHIHSSADYLVYMLGFTPGFCYLGGMDERIACPRKSEPRIRIPAGAVGIAGLQTGIYPIESPGGWQLIGRTPLRLFDPCRSPEFLVQAGDYIRFFPVSEGEFMETARSVEKSSYPARYERISL